MCRAGLTHGVCWGVWGGGHLEEGTNPTCQAQSPGGCGDLRVSPGRGRHGQRGRLAFWRCLRWEGLLERTVTGSEPECDTQPFPSSLPGRPSRVHSAHSSFTSSRGSCCPGSSGSRAPSGQQPGRPPPCAAAGSKACTLWRSTPVPCASLPTRVSAPPAPPTPPASLPSPSLCELLGRAGFF